MAAGAIVMIGCRSRRFPFINRFAHFVADDAGDILKVPYRNLVAADNGGRDKNDEDEYTDFSRKKCKASFDHLNITLPVCLWLPSAKLQG